MSIVLDIYSNVNAQSQQVILDFYADILPESAYQGPTEIEYYAKFTTSALDEDGLTYGERLVMGWDDLALNATKHSAADDSNAYTSIKTMVIDYVYDYINGHTADKYSSGVAYKAPMNIP